MRLEFKEFDLFSSSDCEFDRLIIYDGGDTESDVIDILCGNYLPDDIHASGNSLYLVFTSDASFGDGGAGFHITYNYTGNCKKTLIHCKFLKINAT